LTIFLYKTERIIPVGHSANVRKAVKWRYPKVKICHENTRVCVYSSVIGAPRCKV